MIKMKKCAVFNDLSGFGKCSLAADIPILSVCGIEAHPFPTAVLSNQRLMPATPLQMFHDVRMRSLPNGKSSALFLTGF
jgi:pyridoxal/pyridoxine/pyridoxamine kinase